MSPDDTSIDWTRTEELRSDIGEEDFAEVAALFLSEVAETADGLSPDMAPDRLRDTLHGLKGSALNRGFSEVARRAADGESAPEKADLDGLRASCEAAIRAFAARYGADVR